ncbi:MAG TPA: hypothetical protein VH724_02130, partial [Candidatus Angelobacter sp.]|nr:hypothetical protein [Candidatus Angelobacter sp.]
MDDELSAFLVSVNRTEDPLGSELAEQSCCPLLECIFSVLARPGFEFCPKSLRLQSHRGLAQAIQPRKSGFKFNLGRPQWTRPRAH